MSNDLAILVEMNIGVFSSGFYGEDELLYRKTNDLRVLLAPAGWIQQDHRDLRCCISQRLPAMIMLECGSHMSSKDTNTAKASLIKCPPRNTAMGLVAAWHFWDERRNCWLTSSAAIHKNGSSTWWRQGSASYVPTTGIHSGVAITRPSSEQLIHFGGGVEVPLCDYRLLIFDPFSQQKQSWHQLKVSVSPVLFRKAIHPYWFRFTNMRN